VAVRYVERLIDLDGPRVIVVDDLHWLDPSSAGIFEELVGMSARLPLVVLVGSRPDPTRARPVGDHVRSVILEGLDEGETGELAQSVAGATVDAEDARRLYARTGGNPLFIGETVRAIVDDGAITSDGRLEIGDSAESVLPVTLRALLGSRIDALSPDTRTVLRVGAVLGMQFRESTIEGVLAEPVDAAVYERLAEAAMIVPFDASGGWRFCHPLIQDAAYRSLLATDRRALHGRVADRIEATTPGSAVGVIARHRAAAGDAARAIPLLVTAAEQAEVLGARAEAAAYFTAAADMTAGLEADALRARAMDAHAAAPLGGR
jgi:predicted ATPase